MLSARLLVIACVVALAALAAGKSKQQRVAMQAAPRSAQEPAHCGRGQAGSIVGVMNTLLPLTMEPGYPVYEVYIPQNNTVCYPPYSTHVGTVVQPCDFDAAPTVIMRGLNDALVQRNGAYNVERGVVYTYVYCV